MANYEIFANFVNDFIDYAVGLDPNSDLKILMWDDMLSPFHNGARVGQVPYGSQEDKTWYALDLVNKDHLTLLSWWYSDNDYLFKMRKGPGLYSFLGFNAWAAPWRNQMNIKMWSSQMYRYGMPAMIDTEFNDTDLSGVPVAANYSWNLLIPDD